LCPLCLLRALCVQNINFQKMNTRPIPSSGEQIPVIGIGTWQTFDVGNDISKLANLEKILKTFIQKGGSFIDASPMYGTAEKVVGDLATKLDLRHQLFMATKVWTNGKTEGIQQMEASIQKMKAQPMDLMQVHNLVDFETQLATMEAWKLAGKIRYTGITHHTDMWHDAMEEVLQKYPVDFIQINYSILLTGAADSLLPLAKDKGVAVIVNRPFEFGRLFRKVQQKQLPNWVEDYNIKTWGQFFLKYILGNPAVTCIIPATSSLTHLEENMQAGIGEIPDEKTRKKMLAYFKNL